MIAFPEVQRRAQAEIDAVVGRDRLPTLPTLLIFRTCAQSSKKFFVGVPLRRRVPHAATEDDWYEGMFIPKGTVCMPNLWNCNHDRAVFGEDADEFRPERHLDERGESLPGLSKRTGGHVTFGFGRRICVGKELAYDALFITRCGCCGRQARAGAGRKWEEVSLDVETIVDGGIIL